MNFTKKIGGREFEMDVFKSARDYQFKMRLPDSAVELWDILPESELHVTDNQWGAAALRHIRDGQKQSYLPRLQMYELYLLSLWIRELEAE